MRLKIKILIGFSSILLLMTIIVSLSSLMLHEQNDSINEIVRTRYEKIRLATVIEVEQAMTTNSIHNLLLDPSRLNQQQINIIQDSRIKSNNSIDTLLRSEDDPQTKELLTNLQNINHTFEQDVWKVVDLLEAGKKVEATALFLTHDQDQVRTEIQDKSFSLQNLEYSQMNDLLTHSSQSYALTVWLIILFLALALGIGIWVTIWVIRGFTRSIQRVSSVMLSVQNQSGGQLPRVDHISKDEIGQIALTYNQMASTLEQHALQKEQINQALQDEIWIETKIAEIMTMFQGIQQLDSLANQFMMILPPIVEAHNGAFYLAEGEGEAFRLNLLATYAYDASDLTGKSIRLGEGLVGQCAQDHQKLLLQNVPKNHLKICSALVCAKPQSIFLLPVEFEGKILAVIELASLHEFNQLQQKLLDRLLGILGITLHSVARQMQVKSLLEQSQSLTEELQIQSEELQLQHEELRNINEQLEKQYRESERKTQELQKTQLELEAKAQQLAQSSLFKSEFLANMSHELRTPLNSMLILAQMVAENKEGNLIPKQVEYARSIHSAGRDLLNLINDILDLSKVESGKMDILPSEVYLQNLCSEIEHQFMPVAQHKGLTFAIERENKLPETLLTDEHRVLQILKNLLSNAMKFTEKGQVTLKFYKPRAAVLAISVKDTGIGIPLKKQALIFEAFRQADGTISRKHGGTGLGLAISRELALLLGGAIEVESAEGEGSTFTLYLPLNNDRLTLEQPTPDVVPKPQKMTAEAELLYPDELHLEQFACSSSLAEEPRLHLLTQPSLEGKKVLIVDDDMRNVFALTTLLENQNMTVLFAENGREALDSLSASPDIDLILMDIMMPEMDGYETMRAIRQMPEFLALPILALTAKAMKNDREKCIEAGASDYISKPVNSEQLLSLMRVWLYQ